MQLLLVNMFCAYRREFWSIGLSFEFSFVRGRIFRFRSPTKGVVSGQVVCIILCFECEFIYQCKY